ncbi:MAG: pyridoxal-phosphate dependent enzyme, partial [Vulcanimicrobiaceae bacterium]
MNDLDSSEKLRNEISEIEQRIRPYIRRTPAIEVNPEDFGIPSAALTLKLELMQYAGSFKTRGAFTNLLFRDVPKAGVVAASGGNHGAAVAYAAMRLQIPATIFVPKISSPAKIDRIRSYGARLEIQGDFYADALAASQRFAQESGALPVHAFDQAETIRGQGTLALELEQQAPQL